MKKKIFLTEYIEGRDFSFLGCVKKKKIHKLAFIEEINHFDKKKDSILQQLFIHVCF